MKKIKQNDEMLEELKKQIDEENSVLIPENSLVYLEAQNSYMYMPPGARRANEGSGQKP
jgi:hypothetical protein